MVLRNLEKNDELIFVRSDYPKFCEEIEKNGFPDKCFLNCSECAIERKCHSATRGWTKNNKNALAARVKMSLDTYEQTYSIMELEVGSTYTCEEYSDIHYAVRSGCLMFKGKGDNETTYRPVVEIYKYKDIVFKREAGLRISDLRVGQCIAYETRNNLHTVIGFWNERVIIWKSKDEIFSKSEEELKDWFAVEVKK